MCVPSSWRGSGSCCTGRKSNRRFPSPNSRFNIANPCLRQTVKVGRTNSYHKFIRQPPEDSFRDCRKSPNIVILENSHVVISTTCMLEKSILKVFRQSLLYSSFLKISPPYNISTRNKHIESGMLLCYSNRSFFEGEHLGKISTP